jgi:hypothetical protein
MTSCNINGRVLGYNDSTSVTLPALPIVFDSDESSFTAVTQSFDLNQQDFLLVDASKSTKSSRQERRNARSFVMQRARRERPWSTSKHATKQKSTAEITSPHNLSSSQPLFIDPQLYTPKELSHDFDSYAIHANINSPNHSRDWEFLRREQGRVPSPAPSSHTHCPSLASGSTVSSRNSSTRSTKSLRWPGSEPLIEEFENSYKQHCSVPKCRGFEDDMLTHQDERPEKCPIITCEYRTKGFIRAYDRMRHTNTHLKATMVCGFCPSTGSVSEKSYKRFDIFSRHLCSVHGAERLSSAKQQELYSMGANKATREPAQGKPLATCTLCAEPFDIQTFYEHLPGCVFRRVTRDSKDACDQRPDCVSDTEDVKGSLRSQFLVTPGVHDEIMESEHMPFSLFHEGKSIGPTYVPVMTDGGTAGPAAMTPGGLEDLRSTIKADHTDTRDRTIDGLTNSSRCLSLTSSSGIRSSDEETDWTEASPSPESDTEAVRVQPVLSPRKRQVIDHIMQEFHRRFDQRMCNIQTCHGGGNSGSSNSYNASNGGSSGNSSLVSRKRSLSGGGDRPPHNDRKDGDDHHKRRSPDSKSSGKDPSSELRFACPYYKRNPGRHQTFTSCRDPGFITVARLKEHLYRRHLLPIQCHRCCSTFANEPLLREHQRDLQGCEIQEQMPLEGFDKDQERKLKSKKRSLVHQSEEEKWKGVYRVLFPDDNDAEMPSPYIEYQASSSSTSIQSSNIAHFQEFARLELPRLVRRTLEVVVEQEAQPLEEKLKERLVDIVKECQTQLISMFQDIGGTVDASRAKVMMPAPEIQQETVDIPTDLPFQGFDTSYVVSSNHDPTQLPTTEHEYVQTGASSYSYNGTEKPTAGDRSSGSPDSGYDSTWTTVGFPQDVSTFETPFTGRTEYVDLGGFYGFEDQGLMVNTAFDPSVWSLVDTFGEDVDPRT